MSWLPHTIIDITSAVAAAFVITLAIGFTLGRKTAHDEASYDRGWRDGERRGHSNGYRSGHDDGRKEELARVAAETQSAERIARELVADDDEAVGIERMKRLVDITSHEEERT